MLSVFKQRFFKQLAKRKLNHHNQSNKDAVFSDYYFGYGANLDIERFHRNNMNALEVGSAHLVDYTNSAEFMGPRVLAKLT